MHASSGGRIVTLAATKGGVGKTVLAYELAAVLGGVLVDLDWDTGGASRLWGHDTRRFKRSSLLDAFEHGPNAHAPQPRRKRYRPALIPGHPDLSASDIPHDLVASCLTTWAGQWGTPYVVVDTHPGANELTDGAMQCANLVVVPTVLAAREMDALEGMLEDFQGYRLLIVPNMVPSSPPRRFVDRLEVLATRYGVPVAPPISEHRWWRRRIRRAALTQEPNAGASVSAAAAELRALAVAVEKACG